MENECREKYIKVVKIAAIVLGVYILFQYMLPLVLPFIIAYGICRGVYPLVVRIHERTRIPIGIVGGGVVGGGVLLFFSLILVIGRCLYEQLQKALMNVGQFFLLMNEIFKKICTVIGWAFGCDEDTAYSG